MVRDQTKDYTSDHRASIPSADPPNMPNRPAGVDSRPPRPAPVSPRPVSPRPVSPPARSAQPRRRPPTPPTDWGPHRTPDRIVPNPS